MTKFKLIFVLLALPLLSMSQEKWEGGLFAGFSNYLGDLVEPRFTIKQSSPAFGVFIRHNMSNRFSLRGNLLYGKLKGDDANYDRNKSRAANFESTLIELSAIGEYEFRGNKRWSESGTFTKTWSPYIFGGLGANFGNPEGELTGTGDIDEKDFGNTHLAIPLGLGIRFDLSRKVNLGFEFGERFAFSDYLDGIKNNGDPDDNDVYNFGGVVLAFRFGDKDSDGDGIADEEDKCPTVAGGVATGGCPDKDADGIADRDDACPDDAGDVRMNGCPDRDGDGIADNNDDCPDNAGLRRFSGCPDTDNDNIVDKEDNCPTVAGIPAMNGCPDADRDGITDDKDGCPNEPGTSELKGCPDSDNDGIGDKDDKCPNKPGSKKFNGCPDTDNDGVDDSVDKCPTLTGPASNDGCPEIKAEDKAILDLAMRNVQFETSSSKLLPSSLTNLNQIVEIMKRYPGYKLQIDGYTDNVGNDFANQQLSEARAKACVDYISGKGVDRSLLSYTGHGESKPVADNSTAQGRARNRRVEFTLAPK